MLYFNDMKELKDRILSDGVALEGGILKVDSFINHQMDPQLMMNIAREFVRRFEAHTIDKIITIEASGIAPAILVGYILNKPVLFVKKSVPSTMSDMICTEVFSFTKNRSYTVSVSRKYISAGEKLLFIDDFLANGNAAKGVAEIVSKASATLVGMGFIIEKGFQQGRKTLAHLELQIESLAIIENLDNCQIKIR